MKLALHVPHWPPGVRANGIVTYAAQLVPALRKLGHEVYVLAYDNDEPNVNDPYAIDLRRFVSTPTLWNRAFYRAAPAYAAFNAASNPIAIAVRELVETHGIDLFEMEETGGWSYAVSRLELLPVVIRLHGPWCINARFDLFNAKNEINRRRIEWEGRGIQHAQLVTAPSYSTLQEVMNCYVLDRKSCLKIPNALEAAAGSATWNIDACNRDSLLIVGRFDSLKGGDFILRAFFKLAESNPNLKLTFVGPDIGVEVDDKSVLFESFVMQNFPAWFRSRIEFRGEMKHAEVMALRSEHYATIIASQYESFSYSVLEAMSVGCPVVATAVGGIPELIEDQRNGLLVPSQDVHAVVVACETLLSDPALAVRLGRQAWLDCRESYSPGNTAKQTVAAYAKAIDIFKGRPRRLIS